MILKDNLSVSAVWWWTDATDITPHCFQWIVFLVFNSSYHLNHKFNQFSYSQSCVRKKILAHRGILRLYTTMDPKKISYLWTDLQLLHDIVNVPIIQDFESLV